MKQYLNVIDVYDSYTNRYMGSKFYLSNKQKLPEKSHSMNTIDVLKQIRKDLFKENKYEVKTK